VLTTYAWIVEPEDQGSLGSLVRVACVQQEQLRIQLSSFRPAAINFTRQSCIFEARMYQKQQHVAQAPPSEVGFVSQQPCAAWCLRS
jgi:hypothetical protein